MWQEIKKVIQDYNSFALTTHVSPDGDGLGSACALAELLLMQNKKVTILCDDLIPKKFHFLNYHNFFSHYEQTKDYSDIEVLIILDAQKTSRIGEVVHLLDNPKTISICIDHHPSVFSTVHYKAIDPEACSVGAMLYTLFKEYDHELNFRAATAIYCSIICDTGRFSYSCTTQKAHKIANKCIKLGVDPDKMNTLLFQQIPLSSMKVLAKALKHTELHFDNRIVIQEIHLKDYDINTSDIQEVEHLQHELHRSIEEVECVAILRELPNGDIRASLRSKSHLDVGALMRQIGGGGHSKAASTTIKGPITNAKAKILNMLSSTGDCHLFSI